MKQFGLRRFIETGTSSGSTLKFIARRGFQCKSVELGDKLFQAAQEKFAGYKNVELFHGDSGEVIPQILSDLREPALFWLDGHYSHGKPACGEKETPIAEELKAILNHEVYGHVILIDDARFFTGENDYPVLHDLLCEIVDHGKYRYNINCDIISLLPMLAESRQ